MVRRIRGIVLLSIAACVGCGSDPEGGGDSSGSGDFSSPYADKCEVACRYDGDDDLCSDAEDQCTSDCITVTEGLEDNCAQCVVDRTDLFLSDGECFVSVGEPTVSCGSFCGAEDP